jgi:hypothetical protein
MNKKLLSLYFASLSALVIGSFSLTACAPSVIAEGQLKPTQPAATLVSYPGPTLNNDLQLTVTPAPEQKGKIFVTPLPNEQVELGNVLEIQPTPTPSAGYSIRNERTNDSYRLFVRDNRTGKEVRFGDGDESAIFEAMIEGYIFWVKGCGVCDEASLSKKGLYAYNPATGEQFLVTHEPTFLIEGAGAWIIYVNYTSTDKYLARLHAHNLLTQEDLLLSSKVPNLMGWLSSDFYAINENQIAWVELDLATSKTAIQAYNLSTHTMRMLKLPEVVKPLLLNFGVEPVYLSVSDELVVWRDGFWQGYDLKRDALFTIPIVPPGWENVPFDVSRVTAHGGFVNWFLTMDGERHYFTAPIVPKGQGAPPTHLVPTPHRKPTVSSVPFTPTPLPLPTAYP